MSTHIEWTDETWNPVTGCDQVSPGCDHCYAMTMAKRLKAMGDPKYQRDGNPRTSGPGFGVTCHPDVLDKPLRWKRPRRVFVNSMSDLFHPDVPDGFIVAVWEAMRQAPQHTFQVLTKRPQRMASFLARWHDVTGEDFADFKNARGPEATRAAHPSPKGQLWADYLDALGAPPEGCAYPTFDWMDGPLRMMPTTPLPNVWLGVSIESDRYAFRADHLRATPAAVRWISAEPLLGPLPSLDLAGIDWLVVGGESGANARPMHPDWVRYLRDRCHPGEHPCSGACIGCGAGEDEPCVPPCRCDEGGDYAASRRPVFLFKQWGEYGPADRITNQGAERDGRTVKEWIDYGTGDTHARFGKKAAGRLLDGRTWDEYPA